MQKSITMAIKEKVEEKEKAIKKQLDILRHNLNSQSQIFNKQPNDWQYLATLSHTEMKLKELLEYFESQD